MRIPNGVTDQYIYFVAVDSTDLKTRETGLSSFTVYRSRNGGAAAAYTTPTINETDTTNMPGVYELLLDEDMTIDSGDDSQEVCLHITQASMAPVTRTFELYRPKITAGNTLDVSATGAAGLDLNNIELPVGPIPALGILENGTMQAGSTSSTAVLRSGTAFADDLINNAVAEITGGTGAGQVRFIVDWVSTTDTATVNPNWTTTPDNTSTYIVRAAPPAPTTASYMPTVLVSSGTGTGQLSVTSGVVAANPTQLAGDAQSLTDLKDFADAGYDPSTNKVQGVVLTDTATNLTNLPAITANWLTAAGTAADFGVEIGAAVLAAAAADPIDANMEQINTVPITGNGGTGTEFSV